MINIDGIIGGWEVDPSDIVSQIEAHTGDLAINLNSVGGSVMGGIAIANAMRDYNKGSITLTVSAVYASIASYFAMYADKVIVHDNTTFMIHNAWLPVVGDFNALRKGADISEGLSSILAKAYVAKSGKKLDDIKSLMNEETYYYGADIVANGYADELVKTESETTEAEAKALTISSLEACNNAILQNEKLSIEAVAQLIPKDDDKIQKEADEKKRLEDLEAKKVLVLQARKKRNRDISILNKRKR